MTIKRTAHWPHCAGCGSQLNTKEKTVTRKTDGATVDVYLCRCGRRRRHVRGNPTTTERHQR